MSEKNKKKIGVGLLVLYFVCRPFMGNDQISRQDWNFKLINCCAIINICNESIISKLKRCHTKWYNEAMRAKERIRADEFFYAKVSACGALKKCNGFTLIN